MIYWANRKIYAYLSDRQTKLGNRVHSKADSAVENVHISRRFITIGRKSSAKFI
jgi:hypothetical protein